MIGMKVEDHLYGATKFISWKSRVFILEENYLLKLVNEKVQEPDAEEDKSLIGGRVMPEQEESW